MNVYKNKNNQRKITIPKKRVFQFKSNAQNDNKKFLKYIKTRNSGGNVVSDPVVGDYINTMKTTFDFNFNLSSF